MNGFRKRQKRTILPQVEELERTKDGFFFLPRNSNSLLAQLTFVLFGDDVGIKYPESKTAFHHFPP